MRPTPAEIIAGVRAILKNEIAPSLPESAQPPLKRIMAVLRDARWDDAGFDLLRENAVFAELAKDAAIRIAGEAGMSGIGVALREAAEDAMQRAPGSFAEANAINRQLRAALSASLDAIRDHRVVALDDLCESVGATLIALRTT